MYKIQIGRARDPGPQDPPHLTGLMGEIFERSQKLSTKFMFLPQKLTTICHRFYDL